jgi:uncharacterized protein (DUF2252 family)
MASDARVQYVQDAHGERTHLGPEERRAQGKAARARVPREAHAELSPAAGRDPVGSLIEQERARVPELAPIRHGRMLVSPFTFYRGAALIMATDLAATPSPGLRTQLCGDAHLANFGAYASPERRLVFDINDFDETLPGPFEWDVKRLTTSFVVAGRDNGFTPKQCRKLALAVVGTYRRTMRTFANQTILDVWYAHLDIEDLLKEFELSLSPKKLKRDAADLAAAQHQVAKAHTRTSLQAVAKLTTVANGRRQIVSDAPLIVPVDELTDLDTAAVLRTIQGLLATYRATLRSDRRVLLDHFSLTDVAHKVVGVGSVGLRAWVLLFESGLGAETLVLQAKQAEGSVLAAYGGPSEYANHAERVVAGQHLMQASSDIFLGWLAASPAEGWTDDYYLRQLRDWKASADLEAMGLRSFDVYARLCGWTLARAHARGGDRIILAGYLGGSDAFDHAVADFAEVYADLNEHDHAALAEAVATGRVQAQTDV